MQQLYHLSAIVNYPEDEKHLDDYKRNLSKDDLNNVINELISDETSATSFVFIVSRS